MIIGVDWGNAYTKVCTPYNVTKFPSMIIPYRPINVENELRKNDFIFEYNGRRGLAGTIAMDEQTELDRNRMGDTKLHEDALIRLLIALHQYGNGELKVVVGQPIRTHQTDKNKIIEMIKGNHVITINGDTKEINVKDCIVGVEGGGAILSNYMGKHIHVVDIGSGTINFATMSSGRFINSQSTTIVKRLDSTAYEIKRSIQNTAIELGWKKEFYVTGGGAYELKEFPSFSGTFGGRVYPPEYSNVIGFYKLGEVVYGKSRTKK